MNTTYNKFDYICLQQFTMTIIFKEIMYSITIYNMYEN